MKLFYHPLSTYCHKVLVAAYEKEITFDGEIVNLWDKDAEAKYREDVHFLGKIPVLRLEDRLIPESSVRRLATVNDEVFGILGDFGIEIVAQHSQRRLLRPPFARDVGTTRGPNFTSDQFHGGSIPFDGEQISNL